MNYNEYDSNGNKKKFNLIDIINDKQKRSRAILLIYLVFFILLVIMVRFNLKSSLTKNNENTEANNTENVTNSNQEITPEPNANNELNEMFSDIDLNNYEFKYVVDIKNSVSTIEGKRYNNKYLFTLENNGSILYFSGTTNYIKVRETEDGEYKLNGFPYVLINYFDSSVIKDLLNKSSLNNGLFEISNESISTIANKKLSNSDAINNIEVFLKNNKINKIELDLSNAVSSYMNESVSAKISLEYNNFGLIEDFDIE